jgi:succinate dehydrogenase / fumarate reductase cytochrome b subunit
MAQSVKEKAPAQQVAVELPPALPVSTLQAQKLPSWALKMAMAITGILGALFLAFHLFGNLKVYLGPIDFNAYAEGLRTFGHPILPNGFLLYTVRIVMGLALIVHVCCAVTLWVRSRKARGKFHAKRNNGPRSWAATLSPVSGVLIFVFVIIHLCDLTWGVEGIASGKFAGTTTVDGSIVSHAYENLVYSFERPWMSIIYIVLMLLIAIHVGYGIIVVAADLGVVGRRLRAFAVVIAGILAIVILLGNASIPLYVLIKFGLTGVPA